MKYNIPKTSIIITHFFKTRKCRNWILVEKLLFDTLFKGGAYLRNFYANSITSAGDKTSKTLEKYTITTTTTKSESTHRA